MKNKKKFFAMKVFVIAVLGGILTFGTWTTETKAAITDGKVLVSGLDRSADYYILPDSDRKEISYETMYGLTEPQKQMAINEIYARRGRKFVITEIQDYFNEKSWYKGTVEAEDFDEKVFNDYENRNIAKLLETMDETDATETIYTDFAGAYSYVDRERTVELSVSLYTDVSCENAYSGQECGTVEVSVYYTDGSMAYLRGYLQKDSGNGYRFTGTNLSGAYMTVSSGTVTVSGIESISGTYTKVESYES